MGIDLRIENERAESIRVIFDPKGLLSWLLSLESHKNTICLGYIDPYGDTLFNQLQLPTLKRELESITAQINEETLIARKKDYLLRTTSWPPVAIEEAQIRLESLKAQELRGFLLQLVELVGEAIDLGPHTYVRFVGD